MFVLSRHPVVTHTVQLRHAWVLLTAVACSSGEDSDGGATQSPVQPEPSAPALPDTTAPTDVGMVPVAQGSTPVAPADPGLIVEAEPGATTVAPNPTGDVVECASESSSTQLKPVVLGFAFDVSPSMGRGDNAGHDPDLKWRPVVAATRAFFEDDASIGVNATLTFFPADGPGESNGPKCDPATYFDPDVPLTALPSPAFGAAIDAIDPLLNDTDWPGGGGTPTSGAIGGIIESLTAMQAADPDPTYAVVLVTDGYPTDCDNVNGENHDEIAYVASQVGAVAANLPTYVVGVDSPADYFEDGVESSLDNLNQVAAAGGTDAAFIISTGDPTQTITEFQAAVEIIRGRAFSCAVLIPEPPEGQLFDKERVNVDYTSGGVTTRLVYSPDCSQPNAWHYDNEAAPTEIALCQDACDLLSMHPATELDVAFGCERIVRPMAAR